MQSECLTLRNSQTEKRFVESLSLRLGRQCHGRVPGGREAAQGRERVPQQSGLGASHPTHSGRSASPLPRQPPPLTQAGPGPAFQRHLLHQDACLMLPPPSVTTVQPEDTTLGHCWLRTQRQLRPGKPPSQAASSSCPAAPSGRRGGRQRPLVVTGRAGADPPPTWGPGDIWWSLLRTAARLCVFDVPRAFPDAGPH